MKYFKLRYDYISENKAICIKGEAVKNIKHIKNTEYYLCDVIFFKNKETPRKIHTKLDTLIEITQDEFDTIINDVNSYIYNLWISQHIRENIKQSCQKVIQYPHIYGVVTNEHTHPLVSLDFLTILSIKEIENRVLQQNNIIF